tara:strand:+ start:52 stop:447 length:396 start_codon:yes stop_codon:yes gene_type:complete
MGEKIIWTNGCFDVLHRGHIELFKYAKSLGGKLYVGIDSDKKVKLDKGDSRPINNAKDRKFTLESIKYIEEVIIFNTTEDLEEVISLIQPDIMVIGSDWKGKTVVGEQHAKKLIFFDRIGDYSTTNILKNK